MSFKQKLKIDHYIIEKTIGCGGFGKVKLARHEYTGTPVAIKIINKKKMKSNKMSTKIQREIRLLKYFNHPNMIKLYQVLDTDLNIYMVMEYVAGGELFHLVNEHEGLREEDARTLFRQIISGIEYCHQNLVAHRDLKLENIMVDQKGNIKIVDFGLSNFMKDGQFLKTGCGSLHYAPPEIITGKAYTGAEVDTWSCGVILFAMITGFLPFDDDNHAVLVKRICNSDLKIPKSMSPEAADLIKKMLQVHPLDRIKLNDIKRHSWFTGEQRTEYVLKDLSLKDDSYDINETVLNALLPLDFDFKNMDLEEIKDSIRCKKNYSFVIGYQLLEDKWQKEKQEQGISNNQLFFGPVKDLLDKNVREVNNVYDDLLETKSEKTWLYGFHFKATAQELMNYVLECLTQNGIAFMIKSTSYSLKCTVDVARGGEGSGKDVLDFFLQIYKVGDGIHMVDLRRGGGAPLKFVDFCDKLREFLSLKMECLN